MRAFQALGTSLQIVARQSAVAIDCAKWWARDSGPRPRRRATEVTIPGQPPMTRVGSAGGEPAACV